MTFASPVADQLDFIQKHSSAPLGQIVRLCGSHLPERCRTPIARWHPEKLSVEWELQPARSEVAKNLVGERASRIAVMLVALGR